MVKKIFPASRLQVKKSVFVPSVADPENPILVLHQAAYHATRVFGFNPIIAVMELDQKHLGTHRRCDHVIYDGIFETFDVHFNEVEVIMTELLH